MRTSEEWCRYFAINAKSLIDIPWEKRVTLSNEEYRVITPSVQGFQRGESSEGGYLYRCAKQYAAESGDVEYVPAIQFFIREEQRHARDLGKILTLAGIPLLKKNWLDTIFRKLRHLGGLEVSISVLITAEIIATVYYRALREATNCAVLRCLCEQILRDERAHVEYDSSRTILAMSWRCNRSNLGGHKLLDIRWQIYIDF